MIKNLLRKWIQNEIDEAWENWEHAGRINRNAELNLRQKFSDEAEIEHFVGKQIIVFSNEWENLIVGVGLRIDYVTKAMNPILVYTDLLTGKVYLYSAEFLGTLCKLTPEERWQLVTGNSAARMDSPHQLEAKKTVTLMCSEDYIDALKESKEKFPKLWNEIRN